MHARRILQERLRVDLMGPSLPSEDPSTGEFEILSVRPTDRYLTGILYPQNTISGAEENDEFDMESGDQEASTVGKLDSVSFGNIQRPSSMGVSFAARSRDGREPHVQISVRCARYELQHEEGEGKKRVAAERWHRKPLSVKVPTRLEPGHARSFPSTIDGLQLFVKTTAWRDGAVLVTVAAYNARGGGKGKIEASLSSFFQTELVVTPGDGTELIARPSRRSAAADDLDSASSALIHRDSREYAVGHTCSATWKSKGDRVLEVATTWIPEVLVESVSADGDPVFEQLRSSEGTRPLSAEWLATARPEDLVNGLSQLPDVYAKWLEKEAARIPALREEHRRTAGRHISTCEEACARMRASIESISIDGSVRHAFQLSQKAMAVQRHWSTGDSDLAWRPFQLAFQLLTLESLAKREDAGRSTVDLLWFPTGGGKTEAYLALIAFVIFLRRLQDQNPNTRGAGVAALMRYTLRLLTVQQFQRASRLVLACEHLRRGHERPGTTAHLDLGPNPIGIGLWVGGEATPNTVEEADENLRTGSEPSPRQLTECPACRGQLRWSRSQQIPPSIQCVCPSSTCPIGGEGRPLPVHTVDEDVCYSRPALVIGTIDKFAQIPRSFDRTAPLFGLDSPHDPPDLIVQDELHLISGPLGTIAGIYEIAIDQLCTGGGRPKVIGSTATIRRAEDQILQLFDRHAFQFPPPVLDADNSCFACTDHEAPGRVYLGVTTAGRSAKLMLGAISASLLQSIRDPRVDPAELTHYWTLVAYFNTLRELGGALVLMQDDVTNNLVEYASRWKEEPRPLSPPEELTSRRHSSEIPEILANLDKDPGQDGAYDIVLASNMISVGVDVPRLGLMVVHGQPKGISEYIQATSRVGRNLVPGLIVTLYNNGKVRDRSHYETFRSWHETLYRDVEPTSVTPFAARAQDKALHAALVALVRHLVVPMRNQPRISAETRRMAEELADSIAERASRLDPEEHEPVRRKLKQLLDLWETRSNDRLDTYWNDSAQPPERSLLMSAEHVAAQRAASGFAPKDVWSTLNSMRAVEPKTPFLLLEKLRDLDGDTDSHE